MPPNQAEAQGPAELSADYPEICDLSRRGDPERTNARRRRSGIDRHVLGRSAGGGPVADAVASRHDRRPADSSSRSKPSGNSGTRPSISLDNRRFRANICVQLAATSGFCRGHAGRPPAAGRASRDHCRCRAGRPLQDYRASIRTPARKTHDGPCATSPEQHGRRAGVYCVVLREGVVRPGTTRSWRSTDWFQWEPVPLCRRVGRRGNVRKGNTVAKRAKNNEEKENEA